MVAGTGPAAQAYPEVTFEAEVRVRYRHAGAKARIYPGERSFRAEFSVPQRAITPGQFVYPAVTVEDFEQVLVLVLLVARDREQALGLARLR